MVIGDQDFADGAAPATSAFLTAGAGEPAPFDGVFNGSNVSGPNFSASGNQVTSFTVNGIDLTSALNTQFESH